MARVRVSKAPEERRAELIDAARRLFDKNGVEKTRVSDIVQSVGVAQGVFYYYFQSKEEMIEAVVDEVASEMEAQVRNVLADPRMDFGGKLSGLIALYLDMVDQFTEDDAPAPSLFLSEAKARSRTPVMRVRNLLMKHLTDLVLEGAAQGLVGARYPEYTLGVLEAGLTLMATRELPTRQMIYAMAEEALCLPRGMLRVPS